VGVSLKAAVREATRWFSVNKNSLISKVCKWQEITLTDDPCLLFLLFLLTIDIRNYQLPDQIIAAALLTPDVT